MSGIVGIYYLDGRPVDPADLGRMVDILAHRGPDGAEIWYEGSVGLGHRMLWTTPESLQEKLPYMSQTSDLVITADARIDNRDELITALDLTDRPAGEITDSQLILAAYEKWGERCPEKLLGDFAFAIWDGTKRLLFCARDQLGVKPFYYYLFDQTFIFASENKAIIALSQVTCQLNEIKIADYLASFYNDATDTFYHKVFRLPSAGSLVVDPAGVRSQSYWSLDPTKTIHLSSDQVYAEEFRNIFTQAVDCRLRSAFPIGSLLSGGLDSSSITCVARDLLSKKGQEPLRTFSAIFNELPECDERKYINKILAQNNVRRCYIPGDQHGPLTYLDQILQYQDEPISAPNFSMYWHMFAVIKQYDVRILMDGADGDTTVSHGRGYLHELARAGRWLELIPNVKGLAKIQGSSARPYLWMLWRHYWLSPLLTKYPTLSLAHQFWRELYKRPQSRNASSAAQRQPVWFTIINPDFANQVDLPERLEIFWQLQPDSARSEKEAHYRSLTWPLRAYGNELLDRVAAPFSIEARYPFWDRRLVEFCLALPSNQKLNRGWSRIVMRRAMQGVLPPEVQWRADKNNFAPNVTRGLRIFKRGLMDEIILSHSDIAKAYLNIPAMQKLYQRFLAGTYEHSQQEAQDTIVLLRAISLIVWLYKQS